MSLGDACYVATFGPLGFSSPKGSLDERDSKETTRPRESCHVDWSAVFASPYRRWLVPTDRLNIPQQSV